VTALRDGSVLRTGGHVPDDVEVRGSEDEGREFSRLADVERIFRGADENEDGGLAGIILPTPAERTRTRQDYDPRRPAGSAETVYTSVQG
jgi:hypothetical protein